MKRRIETERVGREERTRHLKLGPGGLSDIEFLIQRLQLAHGAEHPALRDPSTFAALRAAADSSLLPADDAAGLLDGLAFLTRLRQRLRLRSSGVPTDLLPEELDEQDILARSLSLPDGATMMDHYRAATSQVRELFTRYFLES
jgi:[glutamine synthetase] adenylyltransferase / [glutamine synthetase]-adenylyl-L-tyrosine phosphorylase